LLIRPRQAKVNAGSNTRKKTLARLVMTRILAIETSETAGSVAALVDGQVVAERLLDPALRSAQTLAPGIDGLLRDIAWTPAQVELVAVATGPGSFTGLRVGVTTAKMFAYAVGCPAVGLNTLDAIAWRVPAEHPRAWTVIDAQREELFAARYERNAQGSLAPMDDVAIVAQQAWLDALAPGDVVTGPGLRAVAERLPEGVIALPVELWPAVASAVGQVGWRAFSAGQRDDPFALVPDYFRRTAAEEQWQRRQDAAR
jgi:tRNA threonylcarbamoyladenosine biosynthesis protein TsaB